MSAHLNISTIYTLIPNFNLTTLISDSTSRSLVPFKRCCNDDQLFSVDEQKCVLIDFNASLPYLNSIRRPDPSKFKINYGLPCWNSAYANSGTNSSRIVNYFHNGSINAYLKNEERTSLLQWGNYCLDGAKETCNPILITCDESFPFKSAMGPVHLIIFFVSLLLIAATFSLYLALTELRVKIKDKCFMCYLICLTLTLVSHMLQINARLFPKDTGLSPLLGAYQYNNELYTVMLRVCFTKSPISIIRL